MIVPLLRRSRQWHRLGAWGLSVFVLLWTVTGVMMIMPGGQPSLRPPPARDIELGADVVTPQAALAALQGDGAVHVRAVSLESLDGRLYYRFALRKGGERMVDARTAIPFVLDDSTAGRLARAAVRRNPGISSVERLAKSDGRYKGSLPAYRVVFDDNVKTTAYVARDGSVSVDESRMRLKQAAEKLHTFNVSGLTASKPALRRWLLVITGVGTIALILTGLVLLLPWRQRTRA